MEGPEWIRLLLFCPQRSLETSEHSEVGLDPPPSPSNEFVVLHSKPGKCVLYTVMKGVVIKD